MDERLGRVGTYLSRSFVFLSSILYYSVFLSSNVTFLRMLYFGNCDENKLRKKNIKGKLYKSTYVNIT